jgi:hypothetical protein
MKPVWFLQQREQDYDCNEQRLAYVIQEMGMTVHVEKYIPFGGMKYDFLPADQPVVYHGSIAVAKDVRRRDDGRRLFPFGWFDWDRLACRTYYAHWGRFLLNREYGFYPLGEMLRLQDFLFRTYGSDDCVFVRPDGNDKDFVGEVVPQERFGPWWHLANLHEPPPESLCIVAKPVRIHAEYRLVMADQEVVAASRYRLEGMLSKERGCPAEASMFAREVARTWEPHAIYCLDLALADEGWRVIECNSVSYSGYYDCDLHAVVAAMSRVAVREWEELQANQR